MNAELTVIQYAEARAILGDYDIGKMLLRAYESLTAEIAPLRAAESRMREHDSMAKDFLAERAAHERAEARAEAAEQTNGSAETVKLRHAVERWHRDCLAAESALASALDQLTFERAHSKQLDEWLKARDAALASARDVARKWHTFGDAGCRKFAEELLRLIGEENANG